jgi:hypothetical protein
VKVSPGLVICFQSDDDIVYTMKHNVDVDSFVVEKNLQKCVACPQVNLLLTFSKYRPDINHKKKFKSYLKY